MAAAPATQKQTSHDNAPQPCVLVADPDHTVRDLVRSVLEEIGLVVLEAGDATEARKWLREKVVGLVLAEVMLPHTSGDRLAAEIARRNIILALMSGHSEGIRRAQAVRKAVLRKPLQIKDILRIAILCLPSWRCPARNSMVHLAKLDLSPAGHVD